MGKIFIKKGDSVKILSGDYRNKQGIVLRVFPKRGMAIVQEKDAKFQKDNDGKAVNVDGIGVVTKHYKPNHENGEAGYIGEKRMPIKLCKLMLIDEALGKGVRFSRKLDENGTYQRFSRKTNSFI